jgi:hypothetical protein
MRSNLLRTAVIAVVALAVTAVLVTTPEGSSASVSSRHDHPGRGCRLDHDGRDPASPEPVASTWSSGAAPSEATEDSVASVSATIALVTFGSRLHRWDAARPGHVLVLRLDVVAAAGTVDPDLWLDVDGASLLSCPRRDLVPGQVAHLRVTVWVPRSAAGGTVRVTATVRVRPHPKAAVQVFRKTYRVAVCARIVRRAHSCW